MRSIYLVLTALILISLLFIGCAPTPAPEPAPAPSPAPEPAPAPPAAGTGTIEVRATDAPPTGVSSITVTVDYIEVHQAGAPEDSWIPVVEEEKTFNLVEIQGAEVFLGEKDVDAGQYTQIRLNVTDVTVVLDDVEISATLPSDKLKVVRNWEVKPDETTILTLDFEADKFVVVTGNDKAQVKPVLKLEVSEGERPLKVPEEEEEEAEVPAIPHTLEGRDDCLMCHAENGIKPYPADHSGRTNDVCLTCHQPSA